MNGREDGKEGYKGRRRMERRDIGREGGGEGMDGRKERGGMDKKGETGRKKKEEEEEERKEGETGGKRAVRTRGGEIMGE
ncbi:hypothetical protein Pmani_040102 [Petrolisthes manimaculis]|uniref:Uncharacterized protein n=1 Tax=Petrolisthes manimaculis TaxID=1843537 RepID=A0AAE1NCY2_9EUCA|nr:hypothetical protein Pmani_040102 [Petrolisthes manimaculis]